MPQISGKATLADTIPDAFPTLGSLAPAYKSLTPFWDAGTTILTSSENFVCVGVKYGQWRACDVEMLV